MQTKRQYNMDVTPPRSHHSVSRFLRILFSVSVSLVLAVLLSSLIWTDLDVHYTHRAGGPIYMLMFLLPFFAGLATIVSILFYWFDRRALRGGSSSFNRPIVITIFLVAGTITGFFSIFVGALFIFLLLYWLMTGRIAGRSGWSASNFLQNRWDENLYLLVMVVICGVLINWLSPKIFASTPLMERGTPPFQVKYAHQINNDIKRALSKFQDTQACVEVDANAAIREELVRMDWDKILTTGDAEVCSFRLLHEWGSIAEATTWLTAQGFHVGTSFSSDSPYVSSDGTLRVDGNWSIRSNGPRFPTSGLLQRIFNAVPYGMNISATYSPDGRELLYLDIGFSTL